VPSPLSGLGLPPDYRLSLMDELWAVFSSPLGLAVTAGIVLVVYLYYRYVFRGGILEAIAALIRSGTETILQVPGVQCT